MSFQVRIPTWRWMILVLLAGAGLLAPAAAAQGTPAPGAAVEEPVRLETSTGTIHGTLLLPAVQGAVPVALLIAGSGPTDRDGNSLALNGENNSLRMLAEGLADAGVATLRYDKRGVAESRPAGAAETDLRFDAYVEDAALWLRRLHDDPRFSSVVVIGHSEGSLIGMIAAADGGADAFVSMAGISRPAPAVLRDQIRPQLTPELWAESERILGALERGQTADSVPAILMPLYRPSVQPYLISWFRHDPAARLSELTIPVLLVQGTTDMQVGVSEAEGLRASLPDSELTVIEGMNHVLKAVPADPARQIASYSDPSLPLAPGLVEGIAAFIRSSAGVDGDPPPAEV